MSLIVEDGTGRSDAESYLSVADADTYHAAHGAPAAWTGASTGTKETALRTATDYLDSVYAEKWRGQPNLGTQRLAWPRYGVTIDGWWQDYSVIPRALKEATAELALRNITETTGIMPDVSEPGTIASESVGLGSLSKSTSYMGGKRQWKLFRRVEALVAKLLDTDTMERA